MRTLLINEFFKFNRLRYIWLIVATPVIFCLLSFIASCITTIDELDFLMSKTGIKNPWVFLEVSPINMLHLFGPLIIVFFSAFIYEIEKQSNAWNKLLAYPKSIRLLLSSKLLMILSYLTASLLFSLLPIVAFNYLLLIIRPDFSLQNHSLNQSIIVCAFLELMLKYILFSMIVNFCLFYFKHNWVVAILCVIILSTLPLFSYQSWKPNLLEKYSQLNFEKTFGLMLYNRNDLILILILIATTAVYKYFPQHKLSR
ncbi:ABC transporter permease [Pedobacter gandavensis]|uniref:ABC transporter permease n=1 Tax=Pedobacter gandavensis TaxID=2679963 RepID=UPI0039775F2A